jgi:hypothetical protein
MSAPQQGAPCGELLKGWPLPFEQWVRCKRPATERAHNSFSEARWVCRGCFHRIYLKSSQWQARRERELRRAGRRCEKCGTAATRTAKGNWAGLNVHHLTYERLGNETPGDLIVLCRSCHEQEHGL